MKFVRCMELSNIQKEKVYELWNNEYPLNLAYNSIIEFEKYLDNLTHQSHIIILDNESKIIGWYFDFFRDNENWFALILNSEIHNKGIGTKVLTLVKEDKTELNGWVIDHNNYKKKNGNYYKSPLSFYLKNGFKEIPEIRLASEKITAIKIQWKK